VLDIKQVWVLEFENLIAQLSILPESDLVTTNKFKASQTKEMVLDTHKGQIKKNKSPVFFLFGSKIDLSSIYF
jgi:hypothetical protein